MSRPAVFLDRDGTLIRERGFLERLEDLQIFPWTGDALRLLKRAGFATVVVTNQSAIARGLIDEPFLHRVHGAIDAHLDSSGGSVDRYYFCPHPPPPSALQASGFGAAGVSESGVERSQQACTCRKPAPGMIERACREMDLDPAQSVMVGDRWTDVACGRAAGTRTVLIRSGEGASDADAVPPEGVRADAILTNLMEAVGWILRTMA
jgi:D-glycero-D-manno-heptose 1,7-bisphosphate phosphatase